MLGFDDDHHAGRAQLFEEQVGDLSRQSLLNLRLLGHQIGHPREFRQPDYSPFFRYVSNVRYADEREEMMLAHRINRDAFDDDHLVVGLGWYRMDELARIAVQPRAYLLIHFSHASRRFAEPGPVGVLAYAFEDQPYPCLDLSQINAADREGFIRRRIQHAIFLRACHLFPRLLAFRDTLRWQPLGLQAAARPSPPPASHNLHTQVESVTCERHHALPCRAPARTPLL